MNHQVLHAPAFSILRLDMEEGESVLSQPGSMQAMTPGFDIEVKLGLHMEGKKGALGGIRSLFGGESFFTVVYKASRRDQHIMLAPEQMGEIRAIELGTNGELLLARGAFLACSPGVSLDLHYAGVKGLLATRGLFFLKTLGTGMLFLASHGGIIEQPVEAEQHFVVDSRNIVAFTGTMKFEAVTLTRSMREAFFSGEGFVVRLSGPGTILYQTRAPQPTGLLRGLMQTMT